MIDGRIRGNLRPIASGNPVRGVGDTGQDLRELVHQSGLGQALARRRVPNRSQPSRQNLRLVPPNEVSEKWQGGARGRQHDPPFDMRYLEP